MEVVTVIAHPDPRSFTLAAAAAFTRGHADGGHEQQAVDRYANGFSPVFQQQILAQYSGSPSPDAVSHDVREH